MKASHFGGRRDLSFNLIKVWHHSHGFEHSNILKSLQNFSLTMLYALTLPAFQNIFLFARIGHLKKIVFEGRGFWCGSDENMRRTWLGLGIVVVGLPPLLQRKQMYEKIVWLLLNLIESINWRRIYDVKISISLRFSGTPCTKVSNSCNSSIEYKFYGTCPMQTNICRFKQIIHI